jgi:hypothetical protein
MSPYQKNDQFMIFQTLDRTDQHMHFSIILNSANLHMMKLNSFLFSLSVPYCIFSWADVVGATGRQISLSERGCKLVEKQFIITSIFFYSAD